MSEKKSDSTQVGMEAAFPELCQTNWISKEIFIFQRIYR